MRRLILNADQLGLSAPVDGGIHVAHERGIVTCHPGHADRLRSRCTVGREHGLRTLTDVRVRKRIEELAVEPGWIRGG